MSNDSLPPQYLQGVALFNAGRFFACHEVLEELWLASNGDQRTLLHALIQAAAALHHRQNGNTKGAASVYVRARQKLERLPPHLMRLDTRDFARRLAAVFAPDAASDGQARWPQIRLDNPAPTRETHETH
jgi:predicted metal-dependent hydrolase